MGGDMIGIDMVEISTIIALVGCFVGLAGWLSGRDKKVISDAQWRGSVDAKLDLIVGVKSDVTNIKAQIGNHSERISVAEEQIARIQNRLDKEEQHYD